MSDYTARRAADETGPAIERFAAILSEHRRRHYRLRRWGVADTHQGWAMYMAGEIADAYRALVACRNLAAREAA